MPRVARGGRVLTSPRGNVQSAVSPDMWDRDVVRCPDARPPLVSWDVAKTRREEKSWEMSCDDVYRVPRLSLSRVP